MPGKKKIIWKKISPVRDFKRKAGSRAKSISNGVKKNVLKIFGWEVFLFCFTFGLGLFAAVEIQRFLAEQEVVLPTISFGNFITYFLFATLIILLVVYLPKIKRIRGAIYKFFFLFAAIYGTLVILPLFVPDILALLIIGLLIYFWFKSPTVALHDLLMVLSMAGIGAMFGLSFEPRIVIIVLIVLSVYDFIAVYKTKHMVRMAKSMIERGVIMGIIVAPKVSDFWQDTRKIKPGGRFMILGGGDIVFPLIFSASLISQGIVSALIVALFGLLGLIVSFAFFILSKKREPIPALPPIALFAILGYIITLLI